MKDGEILKDFIENQKAKSKIQIAKDLGMTRSNLYQMFAVNNLEQTTKQKFEDYFGEQIFLKSEVNEHSTNYLQKRRQLKNEPKEVWFPVYNGNTKLREESAE